MANMSTDIIKRCPFCGGEVTMHQDVVDAKRYSYTFRCDNCMMYSEYQYCNDKDGAIKAWNTRKPMERIVERLEESCFWTASSFDEDGYCNDDSQEVVCLDKAIEIVKEEGGSDY